MAGDAPQEAGWEEGAVAGREEGEEGDDGAECAPGAGGRSGPRGGVTGAGGGDEGEDDEGEEGGGAAGGTAAGEDAENEGLQQAHTPRSLAALALSAFPASAPEARLRREAVLVLAEYLEGGPWGPLRCGALTLAASLKKRDPQAWGAAAAAGPAPASPAATLQRLLEAKASCFVTDTTPWAGGPASSAAAAKRPAPDDVPVYRLHVWRLASTAERKQRRASVRQSASQHAVQTGGMDAAKQAALVFPGDGPLSTCRRALITALASVKDGPGGPNTLLVSRCVCVWMFVCVCHHHHHHYTA